MSMSQVIKMIVPANGLPMFLGVLNNFFLIDDFT